MGEKGSQGITSGASRDVQVYEDSYGACLLGRGLRERTMASASTFVHKKAAPPALADARQFICFLYVLGVFQATAQH